MESRYHNLQFSMRLSMRCPWNLPYSPPAIALLCFFLVLTAIFHQYYLRAAKENNGLYPGESIFSNERVDSSIEERDKTLPVEGGDTQPKKRPVNSSAVVPPAVPPSLPQTSPSPTLPPAPPAPLSPMSSTSTEASGGYDYSRPVPAADVAVTEEYFADAVFIGDSRTEGLKMFGGPQNATYYTCNGLKVDTVFTRPVVPTASGEKVTVMEALRQESFKKVYIMLGINELGWAYSELFINKYAEVVEEIKKNAPAAQIYLQSILPVTAERSQSDDIFNNANIRRYNDLIQQMAAEKRLYYLDVAQCMADAEGNLFSDASTDGIHLKKNYCERWFDYLKWHYVPHNNWE